MSTSGGWLHPRDYVVDHTRHAEWPSGRDQAHMIQLAIEYDPQPPFDAGSPAKAPKEIVAVLREIMADTLSDDAAEVVSSVGGAR